ncbi:Ketose-bisphosphate aldolase [Macleaya cordata]|uniref:Ketose-bisphosphate aldolase n=1 Tax=Macleaya cordata TaxID=56857 RepID=A0A200PU07_MACCD|nr:Ketose-bisphosphate aldolase [Macleaya cordata]
MASPSIVSFIGLDELSLNLASSLLSSGFHVKAFEVSEPMMDEFLKLGGTKCSSPVEAGRDAAATIVSWSPADQIMDTIFGEEGALRGLEKDAVIILRSTISLANVQKLENHLTENEKMVFLVDAHVSQGTSEALEGKIMITSSGRSEAIAKARPVLSAMCEKLYVLEGKVGAGSKIKMVNELLEGIHLVASMEAVLLGVQAGIHPWILYDIISNAAGSSWIFKNHVPQILKAGQTKYNSLDSFVQNLRYILDVGKTLTFPLPLLAVAHQQLLYGTDLSHISEIVLGKSITDASNEESYNPEKLADEITTTSSTVKRIGFIGLGAMGFGMATHLIKSNFCVLGYDVYKPTLSRFESAGGLVGNSPAEVSKDVDVLIVMVTNEAQAESVLYGDLGSVSGTFEHLYCIYGQYSCITFILTFCSFTALPSGASIILSSTVSPGFITQLERRLRGENKDLKLVDSPVSGGVKRASTGELTIMASGTEDALKCTGSVLSALSEKLYIIKGGCGAGSCVKMVNQLLAGVHIASAAEAMAFGARLGLNTRMLFEVIMNSGGASWMFGNRVPHMLDNDYTPYSALDIFVKDLGIVSHECSSRKLPLHISTVAHQQFLSGSAAGWGRLDDAAVVKVYETLAGVQVEGKLPALKKEDVLKSLPSEWPVDPIEDIQRLEQSASKVLVVLDDDPTGTQTVHDIEVLTEWSIESLAKQFSSRPKCFFILTNSRSMSSDKAIELTKEICKNVDIAAKSVENIGYTVVLRGDSTLRGHFPEARFMNPPTDAAVSVLGEMDAWIICPFFLQGGRYTIEDIHYVADSDRLIPAGETEFAKDASFGYRSSNLREWIEEKTKGRVSSSSVASISIQLLRKGGPTAVCEHLCGLQKGSTCIVNAASERDMAAELMGKRFLCRTAASFVSARIGIKPKAPIVPKDLGISKERNGGLIVVGSYVPKTTKQVEELKAQLGPILRTIEISVDKLAMRSLEEREQEISQAAEMADVFLRARKDTLIMTSRELITGSSPSESLEINFKVSSALVEIVRRISTRPRYILAKGGITSSDLATKALEARHAKVVGQALAGVPLWQLGPESRHPGVPYIVFPGNVGDSSAVAEVVKSWACPVRLASTKDLLLNAEKGGYAVGAFNVYNLEGVEAVIAAAEEEKSPAILQIHPSSLKQGGVPLVACCIAAAEQSNVPITVHFDHGNSKNELMAALELGFDSVMVDGSHLPFEENIAFTKYISYLAHSKRMLVEAELGRLSGTEDDLTVEDYEAKLTDVTQAREFIDKTQIDALAVCIGNVHGTYPASGPNLRLDLLKELHATSSEKGVILVLHGASGLPKELIKECIELGIRKFNVNTEVRKAYMESLLSPKKDLVHVMASSKEAMKAVVADKMQLFGSSGKAW